MYDELKSIAERYCELNGHTFLFVNESNCSFGYEMSNGMLVHKTFMQLAEELGYKEG